VDVVEISGSLQWAIAQSEKRSIGFPVVLLGHQPSRRLWAEPDPQNQGDCWNKRGAQLQSPSDITGIGHGKVCARSKENTESRPKLP
jgi:hypothetical protein